MLRLFLFLTTIQDTVEILVLNVKQYYSNKIVNTPSPGYDNDTVQQDFYNY
jgi:hypothetical protein